MKLHNVLLLFGPVATARQPFVGRLAVAEVATLVPLFSKVAALHKLASNLFGTVSHRSKA